LNTATGTDTTWILTFPTKTFYVDRGLGRQFGIIAEDRPDSVLAAGSFPYAPFAEAFSGIDNDDGKSCNEVTYTRFDRAENTPEAPDDGGTVISPAPTTIAPKDYLCYEANVITFTNTSGDDNEGLLNSPNAVTIDMSGLNANNGWMEMNLAPADGVATLNDGTIDMNGLPTIGLLLKQRDLGTPSTNYASSLAHGYTRDITQP
jgi:hypothetical protein